MTVRPLTLSSLRRVSAPASLASWGAVAALPGKVAPLKLSPFGAGTLRCTDVLPPREPDPGDVVWALMRSDGDQRCAYLILDGVTALSVVSATLGLPAPRLLRPLGTAERGIVAAVIAAGLRSMRSPWTLQLGRRPWQGAGLMRLMLAASFAEVEETLRLDLPPDWLPAPDPESWLAEAVRRGLEIPFRIELARTVLTAAEWSRARCGDVVVFDIPFARHGRGDDTREASLVCGGLRATLAITSRGTATLTKGFQSGDRPPTTAASHGGAHRGETMLNEVADQSLTMLASAPIEVVAEVARIAMRADEITALKVGSVLPVGPLRPNTVTLRVGDRDWAEGELVDVDGQLGVRLTAMAVTAGPRPVSSEADTLR